MILSRYLTVPKRCRWIPVLLVATALTVYLLDFTALDGNGGKKNSFVDLLIKMDAPSSCYTSSPTKPAFNTPDADSPKNNQDSDRGSKGLPLEDSSDLGLRFESRRAYVQAMCRRLKPTNCSRKASRKNSFIFFFHNYNVSSCLIPKAGSSTWRAHLRRVNKGPPKTRPMSEDARRNAFFLNRTHEAIIRDINRTVKIITVRHPLTRLVSAFRQKYRDGGQIPSYNPKWEEKIHKKISTTSWYQKFYGLWLPALFDNGKVPKNAHLKVGIREPIDPKVRYNVSQYVKLYRLLKRPRITFTMFLKHVINSYRRGAPNGHWVEYHKCCCPCYFDYDYVTKLETFSEDVEYIFKKFNIPSNPDTIENQMRTNKDKNYAEFGYYRHVPLYMKKEIYQYVKTDMDLFGYKLPNDFWT